MDPSSKNDSLETLRSHFQRFDKDGNGYIDVHEFQEVLRALGEEPPTSVVELSFAAIDRNEDGVVNFSEFSKWWSDQ